jgi:hypothetical protein
VPLTITDRETAAKFFGMDVSPILDSHIFLNAIHQPPEFLLYEFCGHHLEEEG